MSHLPRTIVVELFLRMNQKIRGATYQLIVDPDMSFEDFQNEILANIKSRIQLTTLQDVKLF